MEHLTTSITALVLLIINLIALSIMGYDKHLAIRGKRQIRLSEGLLFFMATAFGSVGVLIGMYVFRHKTRTWYFQLGIPLLIVQNLATVYLLANLLTKTAL